MSNWSVWKSRPVFVTSTFADMQAERDHLRHHVFPELRERLKARFMHLEPVDLRWGVETGASEDTKKELLVLKVCLAEIERSRPFLVGLIGDRYGWVPPVDRIRAAASEAGFAGSVEGKSVTALEIEYGVLENPDQRRRSRFYFRESLPYDKMDRATAGAYSELHSDASDKVIRDEKLKELKEGIVRKMVEWGEPERARTYRATWNPRAGTHGRVEGLEEWGKQVLEDLWTDLETETRERLQNAPKTWQEQEGLVLEQFVEDRCRDFVGRESLISHLVSFATDGPGQGVQAGSPSGGSVVPTQEEGPEVRAICLVGDSGSGKSSVFGKLHRLLHRVADGRVLPQDGAFVLAHAAGISGTSTSVESLLRRWISELALHLAIPDPTATKSAAEDSDHGPRQGEQKTSLDELTETFGRLLGQAASKGRVVCLIDALNQFERSPAARYMSWLPRVLPPHVRLIATAIPGTESEALAELPWVEIKTLPLLNEAEARDIVHSVCRRYHKTPSKELVTALATKPLKDGLLASGNPLWLELAVEELLLLDADDFSRADREFTGTPEQKLSAMMLSVAAGLPPDIEGLYDKMLARTELLYGSGFSRAFANLIALSRYGWRESDLEALLPVITGEAWDPLRFAGLRRSFRVHLVQRGAHGEWDFFHTQTRAAVFRRNLADPGLVKSLHVSTADYLLRLESTDPLRVSEQMYHFIGADDKLRAAQHYAGDLKLEQLYESTNRLCEYLTSFRESEPLTGVHWLSELFSQPQLKAQELVSLCKRIIEALSDFLTTTASVVVRQEVLNSALNVARGLATREPENQGLQEALSLGESSLGDISRQLGSLDAALSLYRSSSLIYERLLKANPLNESLQYRTALGHLKIGEMLETQGLLDEAAASYEQARQIATSRELAEVQDKSLLLSVTCTIQNRLGRILEAKEDDKGAYDYYHKSLELLTEGDTNDLSVLDEIASTYNMLASILSRRATRGDATMLLRESLKIRELAHFADPESIERVKRLSDTQSRLGGLLMLEGKLEEAQPHFEAPLRTAQRLADWDPDSSDLQHDLAVSQRNMGILLDKMEKPREAIEWYVASLATNERLVMRDPGNSIWVRNYVNGHYDLGRMLTSVGEENRALKSFDDAVRVAEARLSSHPDDAVLLERVMRIQYGSAAILNNRDDQKGTFERLASAASHGERMLSLKTGRIGWHGDLSKVYSSLGQACFAREDSEGALRSFQRALEIDRFFLDSEALHQERMGHEFATLTLIGDLLGSGRNYVEARRSFSEAVDIAKSGCESGVEVENWNQRLALSCSYVAETYESESDRGNSLKWYRETLEVREALVRDHPDSASHLQGLAAIYGKLAQCYHLAQLDPHPWLEKCRVLLESMVERGLDIGDAGRRVLEVHNRLRGSRYESKGTYNVSASSAFKTSTVTSDPAVVASALALYDQGLWDAAASQLRKALVQDPSAFDLKSKLVESVIRAAAQLEWDDKKMSQRLELLESSGLGDVADEIRSQLTTQQEAASKKKWWQVWK